MPKPSGKRSFQYQKRTKEDIKARANAKGGDFDQYLLPQFKMYKPKDGKNLIRILPPTWDNAKHYGFELYLNYGIGVDNQTYLSLDKMKEEKDPILEARRRAEREGEDKVAKALKPRQRILMWIIDRMDEDEGPQLWAAPFSVDRDIASISFDDDTGEVSMIDNEEEGCDVRFFKEGSGLLTKYPPAKMKLLKPSPLHEEQELQDEWLAFITENPLPECLQYYDYEHIKEAFNGHVRVDEDDDEKKERRRNRSRDDDEDEAPRRARSRSREDEDEKPARRRPSSRDEDDEEVPFDADEKPARSRARGRSADADDEDDETEKAPARNGKRTRTALKEPEADEEEEAEKPARRSSRKPEPEEDEDDVGTAISDRLKRRKRASSSKSEEDDD